jgi:hypothetical protein
MGLPGDNFIFTKLCKIKVVKEPPKVFPFVHFLVGIFGLLGEGGVVPYAPCYG